MTTDDDTALTNALGDALAGHRFIEHSPGAGEHLELSPQACVRLAAAVLPIIRKAERDAARAERARIVSERTRLIAYHDSFCGCDDDISTYPTPPDDWEES